LDALGALRDNPPGLELLANVLGSGRVMGDLLEHLPEELYAIAQGRIAQDSDGRGRVLQEAAAALEWREPERQIEGLRRFKRRSLTRIAIADIAGSADVGDVGRRLSHVADACLESSLQEVDVPFAVIAMGRLGGRELSYSSDIDVMFLHDGSQTEGERIAEHVVRAVGDMTPEGQAFKVDAGLRPEGRAGPLVRSFDSYMEYYERWAKPWEFQALLKARPAAGDVELGERLVKATRIHAYPERLSDAALSEIRHLKARMERERGGRARGFKRDLKFGPGGLADVEFSVQLLQLRYAHEFPSLRVTSTMGALSAANASGLIDDEDGARLAAANELLLRIRNRLYLITGRPIDSLPTKPEALEALGLALGYREQPRQEVEEAYLRVTRRCRKVAQEIIFG
jgi:glutamate-ammonia-ligase adenylyltransferase